MEGIQHTAMKVLFDMLFAFNLAGIETDAADDSEPSTLQDVIMAALIPFLSSSSEDLRTTGNAPSQSAVALCSCNMQLQSAAACARPIFSDQIASDHTHSG